MGSCAIKHAPADNYDPSIRESFGSAVCLLILAMSEYVSIISISVSHSSALFFVKPGNYKCYKRQIHEIE